MTSKAAKTRVLLVENTLADAELFQKLLNQDASDGYQITHVQLLSSALDTVGTTQVDVVVLDLCLPDCSGVESVAKLRARAPRVPIVVLTGSNDEEVAIACIDAGAQDYLSKTEARTQSLRRALGYAITRQREAQLLELQQTLEQYRTLSSGTQGTRVTAALAGSGAIATREPAVFEAIVSEYFALLEPHLSRQPDRATPSRHVLEALATKLGDAGGGPRDLLDVHLAALNRALAIKDDSQSRSLVFEGRLLALEMMGLLVDYYRVGSRRRNWEGMAP